MSLVSKLREAFRDKMRDDYCAGLQQRLGIDAALAPRGRPEEKVRGPNRSRSLGLIDIPEGQVRWVNVQELRGFQDTFYCGTYGVPDPRITPTFPNVNIRSVRVRSPRVLGNVVRVDWKSEDFGLGVIDRLAPYYWEELMRSAVDIEISAHPKHSCWAMSPLGNWRRNEYMSDYGIWGGLPSVQWWNCYQAIGELLLSTPI